MSYQNTGVHAHYRNLKDNVPFVRVYRTTKLFKSGYARMKDAVLEQAIDFNTFTIIKPQDLH